MGNRIIPGILEKDWAEIEKKIEKVLPFSKTIHIDLIDGKFADNSTFIDPKPFSKYAKDAYLELHMMVEEPINYLRPFADAGFKRFIGHVEKMSDQVEFVAQAQILGEVGLAVDESTPLDAIRVSFDDLDVLFFMTVKAGASGQAFQEKCLEKIKKARGKTNIPIEVDGGVNDKTIIQAKDAGVSRFVVTSFIFQSLDPEFQYKKLQEELRQS